MRHQEPDNETTWQELRTVLDSELAELPDKYRAPLVLCYLQGKTQAQAARELGCPRTSLASRLARGRKLLRARLTQRETLLPAGGLSALLGAEATQAALPALLTIATVRAASCTAGGRPAAGGISQQVLALAEETVKAMSVTKLKTVVALWLLGAVTAGSGLAAYQGLAATQPPAEVAITRQAAEPTAPEPAGQRPVRMDRHGDPLPPGAIARLGTLRFRGVRGCLAFGQALILGQKLVAEAPGDAAELQRLARTYSDLGWLAQRAGQTSEAEKAYRQALALQQQLAAHNPGRPDYQRGLEQIQQRLRLLGKGKPEGSRETFRIP
jgi:hypothetical protein